MTTTPPGQPDPLQLHKEACRASLASFAYRMSRQRWTPYPHLAYLANRIQPQVARGGARIIVNVPPQHGKTELLSTWLPAWLLCWNPSYRVGVGSYIQDIAARNSMAVRDLVRSDPEGMGFKLHPSKQRGKDWELVHPGGPAYRNGGMVAVGVDGSLTGLGLDLMVIDDPYKNWDQVTSQAYREKIRHWYDKTVVPRLQKGGSIILVMTRWDESDLTGWLLGERGGDKWDHIVLPCLAPEDRSDPLGRQAGQALCEDLHPRSEMEALRNPDGGIGTVAFDTMFQQAPTSEGIGVFKRDWFRERWDTVPSQDVLDTWDLIESWDFSLGSTKASASRVHGAIYGHEVGTPRVHLLDEVCRHMRFTEMVTAVATLSAKWPTAYKKIVENKASGPDVVDHLKLEIDGLELVDPGKMDKITRAKLSTPRVEAGNLIIPNESVFPWAKSFLDELCGFPLGQHDDRVDTWSQADRYFREGQTLHMGRPGASKPVGRRGRGRGGGGGGRGGKSQPRF